MAQADTARMRSVKKSLGPPSGDTVSPETPARWRELLAPYGHADDRIGAWQVTTTVVAYFALLALMAYSLRGPYVVSLLLAVPTAGFLARIFVLFHDCGHGSLFTRPRANEWVGMALSLLVWEAFHYWRHIHAMHHGISGDLDRRGTGDYDTLTVREYLALPRGRRFAYRVSRHPLFLFVVLPCFKFTLYNRVRWRPAPPRAWRSVPSTNIALLVVYGGAMLLLGWRETLLVLLPVFWLASLAGLWLFYVQHQFERAYWAPHDRWHPYHAAMRGSSYYQLPALLNWFTASIGYHHIHHLSPRIPNHRLAQCHAEQPLFQGAPMLTPAASLATLRCKLWDEEHQRMVSFDRIAHP